MGQISTDSRTVVCGITRSSRGGTYFTETVAQIVRDILAGAEYEVELDGAKTPCVVLDDDLHTLNGRLDLHALPDLGEIPWSFWWQLCETDADYYRRQRQAT